MARILYLLRHASPAPAARDLDRPLSAHGRDEVAELAEYLRGREPRIDAVLCSVAMRTRQTAELLGLDAPIEHVDELYHAGADHVRSVITGAPEAAQCVLVVGHAPGVPALAHELADRSTGADEIAKIDHHYPAATLTQLELDGDWADLADGRTGCCRVVAVRRP